MTVGERIKNRREELNMSQDELAKKVGYKSRSSINKLEDSRTLPSTKIEKMAVALECSPGSLMGWSNEITPTNIEPEVDGKIGNVRIKVIDGEAYLALSDLCRISNEISETSRKITEVKKEISENATKRRTPDDRKKIYEKYAILRDRKNLTDYKVSKLTGIPTATISMWHKGKYVPKFDKMQAIANVLEVELSELM